MGAGIYLVWPAFYTDVTDTYRLNRSARLRTDLGGLYFNAIVAVAITAVWWFSGWDALLLVVAAQILQMVRQLAPMVRFDGYHVLADLTGVPDLFSRIGPIIASLWPTRWGDPRVAQLKWWARLIVTLWVLIVVPLLLFCLLALVLALPRLVGTALESLGREWEAAGLHWGAGEYVDGVGAVLAMGVVTLPIVAMVAILVSVFARVAKGLWRRTEGRPVRRVGAGSLVVAMALALAFAWWPNPERYAPIRPYEGGTLLNAVAAPLSAMGYEVPDTAPVQGGEVSAVLPSGPLPTEAEPQLALVLVPNESGTQTDGTSVATDPAWVFPFNKPLPPEPGDNQAFAENTTDGGITYDVAVAMVWVTDDDPVLNVNEAYAFASCSDCVTVAVAFQVVLIVGSADVIIPQNLSAAVNYECFECITAAIASQLVVTVDALPGVAEQIALADLWEEIMAFAESIPTLPLAEVISQLEDYKHQILEILEDVLPATSPESPTPSATAAPDAGSSPGAGSSATPEPSASSGSTPTNPDGSTDTTPTDSAAPTSQPTATPTPSPSPSLSPAGSP
jgi:putative peptide zinc metalloprotease protein